MTSRPLAIPLCLLVAACASISSNPTEMSLKPPGASFKINAAAERVKDCAIPKLDSTPLFITGESRPAAVRTVGPAIQIYVQDEFVAVYLVELTAGQAKVWAPRAAILEQIAGIIKLCSS